MDSNYLVAFRNYPAFPVSYAEITERIAAVDLHRYSTSRNYAHGAVSRLSPYISRGVISGKQVLDSISCNGLNNSEAMAFFKQLAWREYFQRVWQHLGDDLFEDIKQPQTSVINDGMPAALFNARTGIHAIDEHLAIFQATGYMHNHLRMYTASLACNIGKSHWKLPSRWMYYHLLDGDLASNTCSWQWVTGTFSIKKYYFNQDNLNRYTGSEQQGTFIDVGYEELPSLRIPAALEEIIHPSLSTKLPDTPGPVIDPLKPTLIYNAYNLDPTWRMHQDVNRILLLEPSYFGRYPVSEMVIDFIIGLAANIPGIRIYVGEVNELLEVYQRAGLPAQIISKEHPAFRHYPGIKDCREWIFPGITGFFPSFNQYWKQCVKISQ